MSTSVKPAGQITSGFRFTASRHAILLACLCVGIMLAQSVCYLTLGTGNLGRGVSGVLVATLNVIALVCAGGAFRRARGITALFWLLFSTALATLLLPTAISSYDVLFGQSLLSHSTETLLYCLYGAPIMMMLFLPEMRQRQAVKFEIILDLFQVGVVVSLIYTTFFFLPAQTLTAEAVAARNLTINDLLTLFLLLAATSRWLFARVSGTRTSLRGLSLFLFSCAVVTFTGNWLDHHHFSTAFAWFDLGWDLPDIVAAFFALTWRPASEPVSSEDSATFFDFLATNLALVAMLSAVHLIMERSKAAAGATLTNIAVGATLVAFTVRLALTQYHQQQEIAQRQSAQAQLTVANGRVTALLDDARRQTQEITQVSELGSLLQACTSQAEAFRLVPERLRRLFPGVSGSVSLLSPSKNRVESVAEWGPCPPADQIFTPEDCWALRRGNAHTHNGEPSAIKCSHLLSEGHSICIPLTANGETIGTLALQENILPAAGDEKALSNIAWRRQLARSASEHISVAVSNLNLRDALRLQAIRDSLTGLYNRRYMEEFLERELRRAQRRSRPVAVMMLDLDHFKRYNDTLGHGAGDQALALVGETLLRSIRAEDVACRYGGEEFAIIMPECPLAPAVARANDIRQRLSISLAQREDGVQVPLTASIGVAAFDETTDRTNLLLKFADQALYQAKRTGRNRVVAATPATSVDPTALRANQSPTEKASAQNAQAASFQI